MQDTRLKNILLHLAFVFSWKGCYQHVFSGQMTAVLTGIYGVQAAVVENDTLKGMKMFSPFWAQCYVTCILMINKIKMDLLSSKPTDSETDQNRL